MSLTPQNDTTHDWSERITTAWRDTVEGIFRVGDLLIAAKADPHCRYADMALPFERSTRSQLMQIADNQELREFWHANNGSLPASWSTLYQLTLLSREQWHEHQAEITPALERGTVTTWRKRTARATRERALAAKTVTTFGPRRYGVLYADPPWRFEPYSRASGMDRAADNHYPTMALPQIQALKVPAAADAVLFLWATAPMLPAALAVMEAWRFAYKSHFVWVKPKAGTGYWNRNRHELLLIGTKGAIPAPAPGEQYDSVIEARTRRHSAKPFHFHEIIEAMFPTLPRVELFARQPRTGWDVWGNEVADAA